MSSTERFSDWLSGLHDEDKYLGLHPVNRPLSEERKMYKRYIDSERLRKKNKQTAL